LNRLFWWLLVGTLLGTIVLVAAFGPAVRPDWWRTPDQQANALFRDKRYAEAAKTYIEPLRQGTALYRAGDFKEAATAFARDSTSDGAYDHGNALVMLGKYDDAIKSYDRALALQSGRQDAAENRAIAVYRRDRLRLKGGDATGGETEPDAMIFEKNKKSTGEKVEVNMGDPLSDDELRALWLRRVQTKPADFLRAKFAFQLNQQKGAAK